MRMFGLPLVIALVTRAMALTGRAEATTANQDASVQACAGQYCPMGGPRHGLGEGLRDGSGPSFGQIPRGSARSQSNSPCRQ
jgi:hypothetical protein